MYDERRKKKKGSLETVFFVGVCAIVSSEYKHTIRSVGKMTFQGVMCQAVIAIFFFRTIRDLFC